MKIFMEILGLLGKCFHDGQKNGHLRSPFKIEICFGDVCKQWRPSSDALDGGVTSDAQEGGV